MFWRTRATFVLVAVLFLAGSTAFAFHEPGNLACSSCHTMHYSQGGAQPANSDAGGPFRRLLLRSDQSALCLSCHDTAGSQATFSWGGSTPPKVRGTVVNQLPGGNFTNTSTGGGAGRGHSLDSAGFLVDTVATAPGGTFPRAGFHCTSCHDAHGDATAAFPYRNLRRTVNSVVLTATEVGSVNASEAVLVTAGATADQNRAINATNHNVYRGEMGRFCGACHSNPDNAGTGFHGITRADTDVGDGVDWRRHPTGTALTATYATNYGANSDFVYPFVTSAAGATPAAEWAIVAAETRVFCLSCHQAHATGFNDSTRWNTTIAQLSTAGCGKCHAR